jgi:hypothetical protein
MFGGWKKSVLLAEWERVAIVEKKYEGWSSKMRSMVYSAVSFASPLFDKRVGLGLLDFTQPRDYKPFTVGTHELDRRRPSEPAEQSEELTKWVADVF